MGISIGNNESGENVGNVGVVILGYNGKKFAGFARQDGPQTVQGELEQALKVALRRDVPTVCAGRTDSGVHARMQTVSFECTPNELSNTRKLTRSLDALTDEDIIIYGVIPAPDGFSARFDATCRTYRYRITRGRSIFGHDFMWHVPHDLDVEAMRAAAEFLLGEHDFRSFCSATTAKDLLAKGLSLKREITSINLFTEENFAEECLVIEIVGNAFLHSMVRILVGTLVDIGLGTYSAVSIQNILDAQDRTAAGPTAPAYGLTLHKILYENLDLELDC